MKIYIILWSYLFLQWEMFQTKVVEKSKHSLYVCFFERHAISMRKCKAIVEPSRPEMTILHMRIGCWAPNATNSHLDYVILTAFPWEHWLHERVTMLRHTHSACPVSYQVLFTSSAPAVHADCPARHPPWSDHAKDRPIWWGVNITKFCVT